MSDYGGFGREYSVPTYRAPDDAAWYHFLYGSIPGHQIDFIVRPELPHGPLSPQHFSHLTRLIKYIEPREGDPFAFAVANLSRGDTQHVPGHGGLALIFGMRVLNATDHTGRPEPPFSHVAAAIDRELDAGIIEAAVLSLYGSMAGSAGEGAAFYRAYAALAGADPGAAAGFSARYVETFDGLPAAQKSSLGQRFRAEEPEAARKILVVYPDGAPFSAIAACTARLAAILYRSDVRWTLITTGREADITNGVSIFFVPEREARGHGAGGEFSIWMSEIPADDAEAARALFGAKPVERRGNTGKVFSAAGFREQGAASDERAASEERAATDDIDEAPTLEMPNEPPAPVEAAPRRRFFSKWPFVLGAGSFLCGVALAIAWALPAKRAFVLEPFPLVAPSGIMAVLPNTPPEEARDEGTAAKKEERPVVMAAGSASPIASPAKSPPARAVGNRMVSGRRAPGEKAPRLEKAPAGPIYRDLPAP